MYIPPPSSVVARQRSSIVVVRRRRPLSVVVGRRRRPSPFFVRPSSFVVLRRPSPWSVNSSFLFVDVSFDPLERHGQQIYMAASSLIGVVI